MSAILKNLWIGGAVIVIAVITQVLWMTIDVIRRVAHAKAQRHREADWFDLKVTAARKQKNAEQLKTVAWSGWRKFEIQHKRIEDPNAQMCSFYLVPHDSKPIPSFDPGQFLTFQLHIPNQPKPVIRCYSLSDSPQPDHYRVTIKRVGPPRDKPNAPPGVSSNFFHDHVQEGSILDVKAPAGSFHLNMSNDAPVVLIGGGVGLTPVLSMLNAIVVSGDDRETWLFYGLRNKGEHAMKAHLETIAREHPNVHLHVCYSSPAESDVAGTDYHHAEWVSVDLFRRLLPSNNYDFFMCGPGPMMESLVKDLDSWEVPKERIHLEKFGPASTKKTKKAVDPTSTGPMVTFKKSVKAVAWDSSAEHIWEFANANDVRIDSGCLEGNCGTCMTAILSGQVQYTKEPSADCEEGSCLVCCCVPKGKLVLDI